MRVSRTVSTGLVVGGLAALVVVGLAGAQAKIGSGDVVADRQRLMKLNGASMKDIGDKAKAGNIEAIAVNAETLALNAMHITALFPKGSLTDKSNAKADVWDKWGDFEAGAKNLQTRAEQLRDTARSKDADATQALLKDFGRQACVACHTPFRKPTS